MQPVPQSRPQSFVAVQHATAGICEGQYIGLHGGLPAVAPVPAAGPALPVAPPVLGSGRKVLSSEAHAETAPPMARPYKSIRPIRVTTRFMESSGPFGVHAEGEAADASGKSLRRIAHATEGWPGRLLS